VAHFLDQLIVHHGPALLFFIVALESSGVPIPGETTLVAAGVLASNGRMNIAVVIFAAAAGAIVGDNIGYWIGRTGGRRLLDRWGPVRRFTARVMPPSERFFERHGPKTVFLARFIAGLRVTAAWMAGISRMNWWKFLMWNAAGGIVWATAVGLIAYYFGQAVANAISEYGLWGALGAVGIAVVAYLVFHFFIRKRIFDEDAKEPEPS
jgi:membrane protein DedA with SNARE-associated domain